MIDCLKMSGKEPEASDRFTILVMVGVSDCRQFLSKEVGMGSSSHCLFGEAMMSLEISSSDAGRKQLRMAGSLGGEDCEVEDGAAEERDACSLVIFSEKQVAKD